MGQVSPRCSWAKGTQREVMPPSSFILISQASSPHHMVLMKPPCWTWRALASSRELAWKMCSSRFFLPSGTGRRGWRPGRRGRRSPARPGRRRPSPHCPADQDALVLLHVLGADLHPQGDALHLVLGGLPAHGLVGGVHVGTDAGGLQAVEQVGGGVQYALLVLGHGDHHGWMGAMRGGSTRPLLSPWVMMMPPIIRVDTPQEV